MGAVIYADCCVSAFLLQTLYNFIQFLLSLALLPLISFSFFPLLPSSQYIICVTYIWGASGGKPLSCCSHTRPVSKDSCSACLSALFLNVCLAAGLWREMLLIGKTHEMRRHMLISAREKVKALNNSLWNEHGDTSVDWGKNDDWPRYNILNPNHLIFTLSHILRCISSKLFLDF